MDTVNVRNLEQIQEEDPGRRTLRLGALLLAALGGAALVVAGVSTMRRAEPAAVSTRDPLAALVADARAGAKTSPDQLDAKGLSFAELLSDRDTPTTALVAVRGESGSPGAEGPAASDAADREVAGPPPATDQLPVVPLPAGTLLASTRVTTNPTDSLAKLASQRSEVAEEGTMAEAGSEGGYQIQVASFKDQQDADRFVEDLRRRGHKAYRQAAYVADRGLWHRVRIGSFSTKFSALRYQKEFEQKEEMKSFLVDPDKVERQRQARAAKVEARKRKAERRQGHAVVREAQQ